MALHYNLAKVYEISENDQEFVLQLAEIFVVDIPVDIANLKIAIDNKDYDQVYALAHKIKPTVDLFGIMGAVEEAICIEIWAKKRGKRGEIIEIFKNFDEKILRAIKEISKNLVPHLIEKRGIDAKDNL